ncbi:hypothetical protein KFE25_001767 [Diacronema lutheri]|uniref:Uncharacterized protein n=1 Tax=Diacronema lutheri TaxID=2081491 RepID=A0A8J5XLQ8_DIALT|nr:hypothetical protein KFE25_001767 [Diacronema lutheri]
MSLTALERLEARVAAAKLDARYQATAGERPVFIASSSATHHSMEPVSVPASRRRLLLERPPERRQPDAAPRAPAARGATPSRSLLTATRELAHKLDSVSAQLAAASPFAGLDDRILRDLSRALHRHAALSRESFERAARGAADAERDVELARARDALAAHQASAARRVSEAVEAERHRCREEAAVQLAAALAAADARATDEIDSLSARHARELDSLHARLKRQELAQADGR